MLEQRHVIKLLKFRESAYKAEIRRRLRAHNIEIVFWVSVRGTFYQTIYKTTILYTLLFRQ